MTQRPDKQTGYGGDDERPPGFAPDEPTDDRAIGDWATRYSDKGARRAIRVEAFFVWLCLALSILFIVLIAVESVRHSLDLDRNAWAAISPFALAYLGGFLGGTLFTMKWLYHSVAKGIWNRDRRLWRTFTPFLSGGASLTIILLCASGAVPLFGPELVRTNVGALGLSVVFGYFSDKAFSALERLAESNFGSDSKKKKKTAE